MSSWILPENSCILIINVSATAHGRTLTSWFLKLLLESKINDIWNLSPPVCLLCLLSGDTCTWSQLNSELAVTASYNNTRADTTGGNRDTLITQKADILHRDNSSTILSVSVWFSRLQQELSKSFCPSDYDFYLWRSSFIFLAERDSKHPPGASLLGWVWSHTLKENNWTISIIFTLSELISPLNYTHK